MWLTSSSIGRKFVMALTGAFLFLFVTFHVLMNGVALFWPTAYNVVCEFLGANWYALIGTAILALGVLIHFVLAIWLTIENRRARGGDRYKVTSRPPQVEWASKNMLVLGIVIICFLALHMWQFWAKMQLVEMFHLESAMSPAAGTYYIQEAFKCPWTLIIYTIGFIALWFHLTHGFWSMMHSCGLDNKIWYGRLKCIGNIWASFICLLFLAEAIVFTVNSKHGLYLTDPALLEQYAEMNGNELNPAAPEAFQGENCPFSECEEPCTMKCGDCEGNCAGNCAECGLCENNCANCEGCANGCENCEGCKDGCDKCPGCIGNCAANQCEGCPNKPCEKACDKPCDKPCEHKCPQGEEVVAETVVSQSLSSKI